MHLDPTCRCNQNNIMSEGIFSINIAQCIRWGYICLFVSYLLFRGDILGSYYLSRESVRFYHLDISGLGESLRRNGLTQIGFIILIFNSIEL